jgi:hypothetical protein
MHDDKNKGIVEGSRREMESEEYMDRKSKKQRLQRLVYSSSSLPPSGAAAAAVQGIVIEKAEG